MKYPIDENDPLWFLKHNPRAYGEVEKWLTQKRQEKVVKFKYTWEVPMINIDELLEELKQ